MHSILVRTFLIAAVCLVAGSLPAAQAAEPSSTAAAPVATPRPARVPIPPDLNGYRTVIAPPATTRPVKAAIYQDKGGPKSSVEPVLAGIRTIPGATIMILKAEDVGTTDLKAFDVVLFCGGGGSTQSAAIGDAGRQAVREFIRGGGGYVGICAGAYLACNFSWGLGVINASSVSSQWRRGTGYVDMEVTEPGRKLLGDASGIFKIRYNNGPIIKPADLPDVPAYTPIALFRSELAENGTPVGVMIESPAQAIGTFGKGRVFISSPHAENTPGLENLIPRAVLWASGVDAL